MSAGLQLVPYYSLGKGRVLEMARVVSSKAAQAKAREKSRHKRSHLPTGMTQSDVSEVMRAGIEVAGASNSNRHVLGGLPQIAPGEVHCPVCGYGAVSAMTISGMVDDRNLFLHRGRMFPCRAKAA